MFRIGQKVICVDADGANNLVLGSVYTVKFVYSFRFTVWHTRNINGEFYSVKLYEAETDPGFSGFCSARFKPVDERKTDISIFKKMLNPKKKTVNA